MPPRDPVTSCAASDVPPLPLPCHPVRSVLTKKQFDAYLHAENIWGALLSYARQRYGHDGEDLAGQVYIIASNSLSAFDASTAPEGLAAWMKAIMRRHAQQARFRRAAHAMREVSFSTISDKRWSQLNGHKERAVLEDVELVAEARARMRYAPLTELQMLCISARIDGEAVRQTAAALGISEASVRQHNRAAQKKLRAVPAELACEPDLDFYTFRLCAKRTVYHAPVKLGSALAREALARLK